jgi:type II secretory pathway pseudopilin PulG
MDAGRAGAASRRSAFTLVELIVAMTTAAIVIGLIMLSWQRVQSHVAKQRRKSVLEVETDNLLRSIGQQLSRSPAVLLLDENRVILVSPLRPDDTLTYAHRGDSLYKNGTAVVLAAQGAAVRGFAVTSAEDIPAEGPARLVRVVLRSANLFGDSASAEAVVSVKIGALPAGSDHAWNSWNW